MHSPNCASWQRFVSSSKLSCRQRIYRVSQQPSARSIYQKSNFWPWHKWICVQRGQYPKNWYFKGKNDEASNVGGVPNMFIQPSRSSRTNKKQHLKCSAKLSHQSRSCGDVFTMFSPYFLKQKRTYTECVFFFILHGFDHILKVFKVIPIYKPYKSHISRSV